MKQLVYPKFNVLSKLIACCAFGVLAQGCSATPPDQTVPEVTSQASAIQALSVTPLKRPAGELLETFPATSQTIGETGGLISAWEIYPYRSTLRLTGNVYSYGIIIVGVDGGGGVHSAIQIRSMSTSSGNIEVSVLTGERGRVLVKPPANATTPAIAYRRTPPSAVAHVSELTRDSRVVAGGPRPGFGTKPVGCWGAIGGAAAFVEGLYGGNPSLVFAGAAGFLDNFMSCYANQKIDSNVNFAECLDAMGNLTGKQCTTSDYGKDSPDRGNKGTYMDDRLRDCPLRDKCVICPLLYRPADEFCSNSFVDLVGLPAAVGFDLGMLAPIESGYYSSIGRPISGPGYVPQGAFLDGVTSTSTPSILMDGR